MTRPYLLALALAVALAGAAPGRVSAADVARAAVAILSRSCVECHGPRRHKGGLRLDSRAALLRGGDDGPVVAPGTAGAGELLRRVALAQDADGVMPPRGKPLARADVEALRAWVAAGAPWPAAVRAAQHWSFVAPTRPAVPTVRDPAWARTPVDAFVRARLDAAGLQPSPEADRYTLLRRLSFDLIGLPPTPAEIEAFVADASPNAYERAVDRLLASPRFGEKWARPWLDLARYADSHGFQRDDLREIWPYRDWVIRALNADMPFDQLTIEQLAGDLLPNATQAQKIATGFHRCTPTNVEAGSDPEETRISQVIDRVNTTAAVWLGVTLECAQCHDHKYDPFTQQDYYRLFAFFNGTEAEAERANPKVPGSIRFVGPSLPLAGFAPVAPLGGPSTVGKKKRPNAKARPPSTLVMRERPAPRESRMFVRGDFRTPGAKVPPGTPAVLPSHPAIPPSRLTLARWLVAPDNPLVGRVTVNRWWAELFGRGLVSTPEDFGIKGDRPTHPELLDWLAVEFMHNGWSMKKTLRLLVTSATYRQASRLTPALAARDPDNRLLARGPRFRLDAEAIRDNALAVAGLLSAKAFGPPVMPYQPPGLWDKVGGAKYTYAVSPGEDAYRRGVYVILKRASPYPSFAAFDAPARLTCAVRRGRSNTPLQALTLLNDPVYVEAARALARRILTEAPSADPATRVRYAVLVCLGRPARDAEVAVLMHLLGEQTAAAAAKPGESRKLMGRFAVPDGCTPAAFAGWYAVAATLLNLDETITRP